MTFYGILQKTYVVIVDLWYEIVLVLQVKAEIANQILFNTARERLARRKMGTTGGESPGNRWGKTYWQAAAEHSDR